MEMLVGYDFFPLTFNNRIFMKYMNKQYLEIGRLEPVGKTLNE